MILNEVAPSKPRSVRGRSLRVMPGTSRASGDFVTVACGSTT